MKKISNDMTVTPENFWQRRTEFEKSAYKQANKDLKWRNAISFALWILNRAVFFGIAFPSIVLGFVIILMAWETSWVDALNTIFIGHTEPFTAEIVDQLLRIWMVFFIITFGVSAAFKPWKSPAAKLVESEMHIWWDKHGQKLPIAQTKEM